MSLDKKINIKKSGGGFKSRSHFVYSLKGALRLLHNPIDFVKNYDKIG